MSEHSFGFHERPFPAAPLLGAYYPAAPAETARRQLQRCVERAEGVGVLVGAAGMGKSQLLHVLAAEFQGRFHVACLASAAVCTRRALLQNILFELGLPYRGLQEGELRLSLIDHLQPSRQCPRGMVLLIDEAHTLPLRLLEELRLLTNLVREGMPRVRLVIAGGRNLEERLAHPKLDSFQQRIAVRTYLEPWTSQETIAYVRGEIARCDGAKELFSDDALRAIHVASGGVPRLVNQLGDHALTLADSLGLIRIDASAIHAAWGELQRLPTPWTESTPPATAAIEFGGLDEPVPETFGDRLSPANTDLDSDDLPVPDADELFGRDFDSEELVIDRFTALDVSACAPRHQVATTQGQAFLREVAEPIALPAKPALRIANLAEEPDVLPVPPSRTAGPLAAQVALVRSRHVEAAHQADQADQPADSAFDPVYPEADLPEPSTHVQVVAIDEAEAAKPRPHHARSASGGRFRNLFASLRGKTPPSDVDSD
jgi:type II secretory pathway predicted ATPase ExeA